MDQTVFYPFFAKLDGVLDEALLINILEQQIYQRIMDLGLLQDEAPPVAPYVLDWPCLEAVLERAPRRIRNHRFEPTLRCCDGEGGKISTVPLIVGSPNETHRSKEESSITTQVLLIGNQTLGKARNWSRSHFLISECSMV